MYDVQDNSDNEWDRSQCNDSNASFIKGKKNMWGEIQMYMCM